MPSGVDNAGPRMTWQTYGADAVQLNNPTERVRDDVFKGERKLTKEQHAKGIVNRSIYAACEWAGQRLDVIAQGIADRTFNVASCLVDDVDTSVCAL